ncbi:Gibberellin-regulated protein 4 [Sesamum angolense]|uniref:Gibberellin-regulated protein 4 n=1 Tax=Sesamum angolense TaxID=2727404 RepID=A0AAE1WJT7_9LAMI|nr:Gibberellin-regulated protein 4 [Sesamum angolense]
MANKLTALILLLAFIAISTLTSTVAAQYHLDSVSFFFFFSLSSVTDLLLHCNVFSRGKMQCYYFQESVWSRQLENLPMPVGVCKKVQANTVRRCLTFCNKCCNKCLCVPPGYYGNKGVCPCYNNWKTKEGGPNALDHHHLPSLFGPKCAAI